MNENKISLNDGKGLFDSQGLIDTLIVDCNNLLKHLLGGQYIQFCNTIIGMVQKLGQLRDGVAADMAAKDKAIREMQDLNDKLAAEVYGIPVNREEDDAPA